MLNANGSENFAIRAQKQIVKGDFVQVAGSVKGTNSSATSPGCYINDEFIAFVGKGTPIVSANRADPTKLAFGGALPAGATAVGSAPAATVLPALAAAGAAVLAQVAVQPHTAFLTPGAPAAPAAPVAPAARQMTDKAPGVTYEAFMAQGTWTDDLLRQHGYMV